tara:strand:+ start:321 stop:560 length:240 start_codon:yes stop_codon:yes gene_type:complete
MEIKTLKDLKNWITEAEEKFGTDNANLNLFALDSFRTCGIIPKIYKDEMSYNRDTNSINMNINLYGYEEDERTKITIRK